MLKVRDIRSFSWQRLSGRRLNIAGSFLLLLLMALPVGLLMFIPVRIGYGVFLNNINSVFCKSLLSVLMTIWIILLLVIYSGAGLGVLRMFICISKAEDVKGIDIFYGFRHFEHWKRFTELIIIISSIHYIISLPLQCCSFYLGVEDSITLGVDFVTRIILLFFSLYVLPAPYILADHPELDAVRSLKASIRLMQSRKLSLFLLQLSFVPAILLFAVIPFFLYISFFATGNLFLLFMSVFLSLISTVLFCLIILPHMLTAESTFCLYSYGEDYPYINTFKDKDKENENEIPYWKTKEFYDKYYHPLDKKNSQNEEISGQLQNEADIPGNESVTQNEEEIFGNESITQNEENISNNEETSSQEVNLSEEGSVLEEVSKKESSKQEENSL